MGDALATSPLLLLPLQPPQPPRIRTLFLLNSLCMGGAEKQVVSLFNRLGNDHAINPHSDTETDTDTVAAWLVCLKADYALLPQVDALRRPQVLPWLGVQRGFAWSAVRRLAAQIDALDINVLVCTNLYALLYGWLARRMSRRGRALRLVEVFHTTDIGSRKERFEMALYRRLLPSTDLLVYVCHGQAEQWRAQGLHARQDMVVYNGIDTRHFENHWTAPERAELRRAQGLGAADYVIGLCAVMR
ncbi:MAG: glycosyltransferase family 4 protein, partial [Leptothrix sp. (in: b-proteobacteria)]